jgi:hypothetical protein
MGIWGVEGAVATVAQTEMAGEGCSAGEARGGIRDRLEGIGDFPHGCPIVCITLSRERVEGGGIRLGVDVAPGPGESGIEVVP